MVRYGKNLKLAELNALIDTEKAGWLERTRTRTESFQVAGAYTETSGI
ncbi:MAG: hypothetical protein R3F19_29540 [Verrucomicrobiales bacterium]